VIVDFANGARAMLELCMFAEGARYQEEISAVGPWARSNAWCRGRAGSGPRIWARRRCRR
jgi:myo-inositol 2-dehydrogenase / D-chiro-inositol 1-dehydrogenase